MLNKFVSDFLLLVATIDPVGTLSIFVGLTAGLNDRQRTKAAIRSVVYAAVILLAFLVVGQLLLAGIGVELEAFQLSGGVILFLFGLQMVFGEGPAVRAPDPEAGHDVAVFPLAIPSIAGPGSILAIVVLTDNHRYSVPEQAGTAIVLVVVLALTLVLLLAANRVHRVIGDTGAQVIIRIMGLLLCALAAEQVIDGIQKIAAA